MSCSCLYKMPLRHMIKHPLQTLEDLKLNIKYSVQRIRRGWCDRDTFDIDMWFLNIFPEMLTYFKEKALGYPAYYIYDKEMTEDEWDDILDEMIKCFKKAGYTKHGRYTDEAVACKNRGFELLSKYFYFLWD